MAQLCIHNVSKKYGSLEILKNINLNIQDKQFVCFLGPSGCGKSTLLRCIAGLEKLNSGQIVLGDDDITNVDSSKRNIAMVFQSYALYPHMNVYNNMAFGLSFAGFKKSEIKQRVLDVAKKLEIESLLKRRPKQLSGGQKQRVAIGRAIVRNPKLFLLDEPLSNLDAALRVVMRSELKKLHASLQTTIIYVTHDQVEAMTLSNKVVVLNEGRVEQSGKPLELFNAPANVFVAGFIGSPKMNFLEVQCKSLSPQSVTVHSTHLQQNICIKIKNAVDKKRTAGTMTLGIRPHDVEIVNSVKKSHITGIVTLVEQLGNENHIHLITDNSVKIVAVKNAIYMGNVGDTIYIQYPSEHCHIFDNNGQALPRCLPIDIENIIKQ